jgi:hypothetical protein
MPRRQRSLSLLLAAAALASTQLAAAPVQAQSLDGLRPPSAALLPTGVAPGAGWSNSGEAVDPLTGPRSRLGRDWVGLRTVATDTPILVLAGHADSQNIAGSGTPGEAVALRGAPPMYPGISDELYWNLVIATAVVQLGQQRGLNIRYYRPPFRTIVDADHPGTNWSVGRDHANGGGYSLEIHFDAYGRDGVGSGLIPPVHRPFSRIDESLAREFGGYPMAFRNVLGGPKRGIGLLEIGKLEGPLEASLRNPYTRNQTVQTIAERVVRALEEGMGRRGASPAQASSPPPGGGSRTARR